MPRVRFNKPNNGYVVGDEADFDPGVADALVNWARVADYVTTPTPMAIPPSHDDIFDPSPSVKVQDGPPQDKMIKRPAKAK